MNKKLISKLNMYLAVQQTLQANQSVVTGFTRLNTEVVKFGDYINQINAINTSLSNGTYGITNSVSQLETEMILAVCKLSRTALVWAKDMKNMALIGLFDITKSDLNRLPDSECYAKVNAVLTEIEANKAALATAVNVEESSIVAARLLITNYQASLGSTQNAVKSNKNLNNETKNLFSAANESLNIITDLVVNAIDDQLFANALIANKNVNDSAVRKTGINITVIDSETLAPITTAIAYLEGSDKKDEADQEGICELYKLRTGNYIVRIAAIGYETASINALVEQGKITDLDLSLVKAKN